MAGEAGVAGVSRTNASVDIIAVLVMVAWVAIGFAATAVILRRRDLV